MESIDALKGFNYRDAIRKQVALATRNRTPDNKVVGGVYYAKGNVKLSKIQNEWRTIIVEDGNLIIDQDISDRSKTYGIIVLRTGDDDST